MDQTTQAIEALIVVLIIVAIVCFALAFNDNPRNDGNN